MINSRAVSILGFMGALIVGMFLFSIPLLVNADQPLVPCSGADCDFYDLIELIKRVINFLIFKFAVPLAAVSFAIAGVIILTAGGNESKVEQGKEIAWNVVIGLIIALSAWLVINAILLALGPRGVGQF